MATYDLSALGVSTSAGTATFHVDMALVALGASISSGTANCIIIRQVLVTQAGAQFDVAGRMEQAVTQIGAQIDAARVVPQRVTQAAAQIDVSRIVPERVTQTALGIDVGRILPLNITQVALQVDTRYRRPLTTVDCWEFHIENRGGTYLAFLDNAFGKSYLAQLGDVGGGSFMLPADDSKATDANLKIGNVVKVRYQNVDIGAWVIEDISQTLISHSEGEDEIITVAGRGLLALLDDGLVYPADVGDPATSERSFSSATKASIFISLNDEFVARGGGDLSPSFTASLDTDLNSWTDSVDLSFKLGQTLLDVIRHLGALGLEVIVDHDKALDAYVSAGSDLTDTVIFRHGLNILSCTKKILGAGLANAVLGEGRGHIVETEDATSICDYGRREGYLPLHNTDDSAQVTEANDLFIAEYKEPVMVITLGVSTDTLFPINDYDVGDTIRVEIPDKISADYRVRSIVIQEGDGPCDLRVMLEVNNAAAEYLIRLQQSLRQTLASVRPGPGDSSDLASKLGTSSTAGNALIKDTHIDWGAGEGQVNAADVPIGDAGACYAGATVEAALQELCAALATIPDSSNLGFFGTTPISKRAHIVDANGTLADITTKFNDLLAKLEAYGLLASS